MVLRSLMECQKMQLVKPILDVEKNFTPKNQVQVFHLGLVRKPSNSTRVLHWKIVGYCFLPQYTDSLKSPECVVIIHSYLYLCS